MIKINDLGSYDIICNHKLYYILNVQLSLGTHDYPAVKKKTHEYL